MALVLGGVACSLAAGASVDAHSLGADPERNAGNSRVEERRAEKQRDRDRREAEKQRQKDMMNPPKWDAAKEDSEWGVIPRLPALVRSGRRRRRRRKKGYTV